MTRVRICISHISPQRGFQHRSDCFFGERLHQPFGSPGCLVYRSLWWLHERLFLRKSPFCDPKPEKPKRHSTFKAPWRCGFDDQRPRRHCQLCLMLSCASGPPSFSKPRRGCFGSLCHSTGTFQIRHAPQSYRDPARALLPLSCKDLHEPHWSCLIDHPRSSSA